MARPGLGGAFIPAAEEAVAHAITDALEQLGVGAAFGSLASGADILAAEAALARGAELHVVLPFGPLRFKAEAVAPSGAEWERRFDAAVRRATSVEVLPGEIEATNQAYATGARRAMDRAVLRARMLGTEPVQLAVWDGQPVIDGSTVDAELKEWQLTGLHSCIIPPTWSLRRKSV